jgi:hypothetical protein
MEDLSHAEQQSRRRLFPGTVPESARVPDLPQGESRPNASIGCAANEGLLSS